MEFLNGVGVDRVMPEVLALANQLEAGVRNKGYELISPRTAQTGSGIVTFRKEGVDSRMIVKTLRDHGIIAAPRQGWVRTSPHFYIAPDEIDRMLTLIP